MDVGNITKAATFKSFLRLSYKITNDDFWGFTQKYELRVSFGDDNHFFPYFLVSS